MSHTGHFQYKCSKCQRICGGCRCMEPGKETRPTICEDCDPHLNLPAPAATVREPAEAASAVAEPTPSNTPPPAAPGAGDLREAMEQAWLACHSASNPYANNRASRVVKRFPTCESFLALVEPSPLVPAREWELKGFDYVMGGVMNGVNCGPALALGETVRVREAGPAPLVWTKDEVEDAIHNLIGASILRTTGSGDAAHARLLEAADQIRKMIPTPPPLDPKGPAEASEAEQSASTPEPKGEPEQDPYCASVCPTCNPQSPRAQEGKEG